MAMKRTCDKCEREIPENTDFFPLQAKNGQIDLCDFHGKEFEVWLNTKETKEVPAAPQPVQQPVPNVEQPTTGSDGVPQA